MDKLNEIFESKTAISRVVEFKDGMYVAKSASRRSSSLAHKTNAKFEGFKLGYEAAKASQWISVEEDEPELGEEVAVAWDGCDELSTDYLEIDSDYGTHYWANYHAEPPTHWKRLLPLPEAPE